MVCEIGSMGEKDEGNEGEEGTEGPQDSFDVPSWVIFLQSTSSLGGEEGSHGGLSMRRIGEERD